MGDMDNTTQQELSDIANKLRIHSINATSASKSGHPTSCASAAEIVSTLFFHTMKYDAKSPRDPSSDRFILSKGHAAPLLYAAWVEAGFVKKDDLLNLRKIDSTLQGHPTPELEFVDVATGSLGQGLSCAAGMAYVGKNIDKASYRVYCVIGDGESAEGSVWEALHFAGIYKLDNLCAIFDVNRLGQSQAASLGHDIDTYVRRLDAFGWNAIAVDGHSVKDLIAAFDKAASTKGKPTALIAKTYKGHGFPEMADKDNWHGKPLGDKAAGVIEHLQKQIKNDGPHKLCPKKPKADAPKVDLSTAKLSEPPNYNMGDLVATRLAYGTALPKLGKACDRVVALDGDTKNSTYSDKFLKAFPDRFIECFIAEQNLVGVAVGCGTRGRTIPFCSTFATFFTRAFDQLRMGAISQANIKFVGSHVGISIGEDGPSQMGLEDIAMFRTLPGSTVFYPSDAVSCERAVELAAQTQGICFIRTSRPATPVIYANDEPLAIGKANLILENDEDRCLIIGAGVTLVEAMKAADALSQEGINVAVLDPFTIKPLDVDTIVSEARRCNSRVLTVEEHYRQGGIGEAVCAGLADCKDIVVKVLAVDALPRSGPASALLEMFGISASHIAKGVKSLIS